MLTRTLHTGSDRQPMVCGLRRQGHQRRKLRASQSQSPRLVKRNGVYLVGNFQSLRVFDQHALLRRHARSSHDGHRRGQA